MGHGVTMGEFYRIGAETAKHLWPYLVVYGAWHYKVTTRSGTEVTTIG